MARRSRRWAIATITLFGMLGLSFGAWLSRLPAIRDHTGASTLEVSAYGLCMAVGSLTGLIFSGRVVSWFGPRRTLIGGLIGQMAAMIGTVLLIWSGQLVWGLMMLVAYGLFFSTSDVAVNVTGAEAERALGRPWMPLFHGAYSLGAVATMGLGAAAEALRIDPPLHVTIILALVVAIGLLALRWIPRDPPQDHLPHAESTGSVITGPIPVPDDGPRAAPPAPAARYNPWRDPRIYLIGLITLAMSLAEGTGSDWISLALVDGRGFGNSPATLTVAAFFAAMVLTRFAGPFLLMRFDRVITMRGSAVVGALGVLIVILIPHPWAAVLGTVLWGAGCALGFPVGVSAAADDPATATRSVAAVSAIAYGAYLIGPPMIGFLGEHFGLLAAFWPVAAVMLLCILISGAVRQRPAGAASAPHRRTRRRTRER